ncbi:hypothetical protein B7494_g3900 [Chlorociboria aeruginascens]|nr:hypothetical protein B7494_g3900 [Chlorociboria aeruginascens]
MGIGFGTEAVYAPFRRRETSLEPRIFNRDLEKEWTATRCHRLLRPLTSRIAILNKEQTRFPAKRPIHVVLPDVEAKQGQNIWNNKLTGDAHWIHPRKRVRYTYSGQGGKSARSTSTLEKQQDLRPRKNLKTLIPGEISVPTSILKRARESAFSSQIVSANNAYFQLGSIPNLVSKNSRSRGETNFQLLRGIRKTTSTARYSIYEGIYNGLEALLKATMLTESEKNGKGSRSLLSACLKTIPAYIAEEEALALAYAENNGGKLAIEVRDISTEVYSDLEAFGSLGRGWHRLKVVVRSHAIEVVRKAICAGLLDIQFCGALVTLCIYSGSLEEAERLLSSVLEVGHFSTPKTVQSRFTDDDRNYPLSMLWKFVEDTALSSYQYRQLSIMFCTEQVPLGWLATKDFGNFWIAVIKAIATNSTDADTYSFITVILPLMARPDLAESKRKVSSLIAEDEVSKALKHTFSSVLATISAIGILDKRNATDCNLSGEKEANLGRVDSLLRSCVIECRRAQYFTIRYTLLLLANLMVECEDGNLPNSSRDLAECLVGQMKLNGSASNSATYGDLIQFITLMARCCGRGVSASGFGYLKCTHQVLELLAAERESNIAATLFELMVDSALLFAEEEPNDEHVEYATHLDSRFCSIRTKTRPNRNSRDVSPKISGFRWEEGISEWVTATPTTKGEKVQTFDYFSEDDSECDTPFRPPCRKTSDGAVFGKHAVAPRILRSSKPTPTIPSSDDLLAEGFATPSTRSSVSHGSRQSHGQRKYVNRAPGLKRRALQTRRDWQLFDDSDDELSFALSQDDHALPDITNIAHSSFNSINETTYVSQTRCKVARSGRGDLDDSEDELCV